MRRPLMALALALALPAPVLAGQVVVREGESLSEIADRHGISISRLIELNGIRNPNMVEAGSLLRIPGESGGGSSSTRTSGRSVASGGRIVVQEGDTLSEIASRHGVSMATLMKANGLASPDLVEAGRSLVLPGAGGSSRPQGGRSTAAAPAAPFTYNPRARNHVVRSGESLSAIADGYGIPMERLVALNSIKDPDMVPAGLQLKLRPEPVAPLPPVRPRAAVRPTTPRPAATTARVQPAAPRPASPIASRPQPSRSGSPAVASTSLRPASPRTTVVVPATAANHPTSTTAKPLASAALVSRPSSTTSAALSPASSHPASINLASGMASRPTSHRNQEPTVSPNPSTASSVRAATVTASTVTAATASATTMTAATTAVTRPFSTNTLGSSGPALARASTPTSTSLLSSSTTRTTTASSRPGAASSSAAAATPGAASSTTIAMASRPDWRSYGPLQVDWANWQTMGGSVVAPTLSSEGQSQYLAINCNARKMNTTSRSGQWNSWSDPRSDFEQQLLTDACKPRS